MNESKAICVKFYESAKNRNLKYSVIVSRYRGKWLLCKHHERETFEIPGGHRESGETPEQAARRELYEETGAVRYALKELCVYSVAETDAPETFGMLYFADIEELSPLPDFEMERVECFDDIPERLTYPEIQPFLLCEAVRRAGL